MSVTVNIVSATNFTDESNPSFTYSRQVTGSDTLGTMRMSIYVVDDNGDQVKIREISVLKSTLSYTVELTDTQRDIIRESVKTRTSATVIYELYYSYTTSSGNYGSYVRTSKTVTIVGQPASISITAVDQNTKTTALTGSNTKFVRYHSTLACNVNCSIPKKATLDNIVIRVGDNTYTDYNASTGLIVNGVNSPYIEVTITDSRGFQTVAPFTLSMVDYISPTVSVDSKNMSSDGEFTLDIGGVWFNGSFGSSNNSLNVYYRYKVNDGSFNSWAKATHTSTNNSYEALTTITGLNYKSRYTFQAKVTDALNTVESVERIVTFDPVFDWSSSDFKFNVPVNCKGNISVEGTADFQNGVTFESVAEFQGNITAIAAADFQGNVNLPTAYVNEIRDKNSNVLLAPKASYLSAGIDPDTTLDSLILTQKNTPNSVFMYIRTDFYGGRTTTSNRMQTAFYYNQEGHPYYRYYYNGVWSSWLPMSGMNYSTGELATGDKWIDGKPIYRKVVQTTVTTTGSNVVFDTIADIDHVVDLRGTMTRTASNSQFGSTFWQSSSSYHTIWIQTGGKLTIRTTAAVEIYIIIEYTKTTD